MALTPDSKAAPNSSGSLTGSPITPAVAAQAKAAASPAKLASQGQPTALPAATDEHLESPKPHTLIAKLAGSYIFESQLAAAKDPALIAASKDLPAALALDRQKIIDALVTSYQDAGLSADDAKSAASNVASDIATKNSTLTETDPKKRLGALYTTGAATSKSVASGITLPGDQSPEIAAYKEQLAKETTEARLREFMVANGGKGKSGPDLLMSLWASAGTVKSGPFKPLDIALSKLDDVALKNLSAIHATGALKIPAGQVATQASLVAALSHYSFSIYFDPLANPTVEAGAKIAMANVKGYGGSILDIGSQSLTAGADAWKQSPATAATGTWGDTLANTTTAAGNAAKAAAVKAKDAAPEAFNKASQQIDSQIRVDALSKVAASMIHRGGDSSLVGVKATPEILNHLTPEALALVKANRDKRTHGRAGAETEITMLDIASALHPEMGKAAYAMTGSYPRGIGVDQIPISKDLHQSGNTLWANAGGPPAFDPAMEHKYRAKGLIVDRYQGQLSAVRDQNHDRSTIPGSIFGVIGHTKPADGNYGFTPVPYSARRARADQDALPPRG